MLRLARCLALLLLLNAAAARPSPVARDLDLPPKPTRLFTAASYESPYPVGQGHTGLTLRAEGGSFYLKSGPGAEAVLYVDNYGHTWLVGTNPHPPFLPPP
jgi:hypothetical protein